jgi:hypothetical protein
MVWETVRERIQDRIKDRIQGRARESALCMPFRASVPLS